MLNQEMALDAIDLDLHSSVVGLFVNSHWLSQRATSFFTQVFDCAKCGARRTTDIIHASFQSVQLFNNSEWNHNIATNEVEHAHWICNKNGSVKYNSSCSRCCRIYVEESAI